MPTLCSLNLFNWSDFIPNFTICSQLGRRILLFVSESIWAELGVAGRGDRTGPLLHTDFVTTNNTWSDMNMDHTIICREIAKHNRPCRVIFDRKSMSSIVLGEDNFY